jgi:ribosomal protein S19E (S16A)
VRTTNQRSEAATPMRIPSWIPIVRTAAKVTPRSARSERFTRQRVATCLRSMSPKTAVMMIAARVAFGRKWRSGVRKRRAVATMTAVMIPASGVSAPACSLTAVREKPPVTG